jgi:SAM-dependent methyltransferase
MGTLSFVPGDIPATRKGPSYFEYDLYRAQRYGNIFEKVWHNHRIKCLLDLLERSLISKAAKIMELGCNTGPVIIALYNNKYFNVFGIDISLENVKRTRSYCIEQAFVNIPLCVADGSATPFRSGEFDVILLVDLLEHAFGIKKIIKEAERILRPGGKIVVAVPHRRHPISNPLIKKLLSGRDDIDTLPDYFLTKKEIQDLFEGFYLEYFSFAAFWVWFCFIFRKSDKTL